MKRSGMMRCRPGIVPVRGGPGSAVHRYTLHRIRDTWPKLTLKIPIVASCARAGARLYPGRDAFVIPWLLVFRAEGKRLRRVPPSWRRATHLRGDAHDDEPRRGQRTEETWSAACSLS